MDELTRIYELMGHLVWFDGISGYLAIGFSYCHKNYIKVKLTNHDNDGKPVEFTVESWRVSYAPPT